MKNFIKKNIDNLLKAFGLYICKLPRHYDVDFGSIAKAKYFDEMFSKIHDVEGDVVECGVGAGESIMHLSVYNQIEGKNRYLYGRGFPNRLNTMLAPEIRKKENGK